MTCPARSISRSGPTFRKQIQNDTKGHHAHQALTPQTGNQGRQVGSHITNERRLVTRAKQDLNHNSQGHQQEANFSDFSQPSFCSAQNVRLWLPASTAIVLIALRTALHTFFYLRRAVCALFQETSLFSGDGRINLYKRI